jgi:hypothetical protein
MLDQIMLREQFESLLTHQRAALGKYESAAADNEDPQTKAEFDQLCKEKKRHIQLTERLLEIVE